MTLIDKACAILKATEDGNKLRPSDLSLVESAVNGRLTERGVEVFDALHQDVISGDYLNPESPKYPWFHGIVHLTRDHQGYVYWKGQCIEHYTYPADRKDAERESAHRLAANCRSLEEKGIPVNGRTAIGKEFLEAPAQSPWLKAMLRYYTFFGKEDGTTVGIFFRNHKENDEFPVVVAYKEDGVVKSEMHVGGYEAYHAVAGRGLSSTEHHGYAQIVGLLEKTGLTPADIDELLGEPA